MTLIEIKPHRWGWKVFEASGVEPVFPEKRQAINYAQSRASFRSGEIRILDSSGGSCLSRRSSIQGRITKRLGSPYDSPLSTETAERSSRKSLARLHFGYVLDREDMNRLAFHRHPRDLVRTNSLWIVKHRRVKSERDKRNAFYGHLGA